MKAMVMEFDPAGRDSSLYCLCESEDRAVCESAIRRSQDARVRHDLGCIFWIDEKRCQDSKAVALLSVG